MNEQVAIDLLELRCKLEILITEREGMRAENMWRTWTNCAPAYTEDSFALLAKELKMLIGKE